MAIADNENVGIAFALVIAAGASTALGASVVFFPSLVKLASRKTLASGLGLSSGVMTYVSFVEIFGKSIGAFGDAGHDPEKEGYVYATLTFFAGSVSMVLLNLLVHNLLGYRHHSHEEIRKTQDVSGSDNPIDSAVPPCCDNDPVGHLDQIQNMAEAMEAKEEKEDSVAEEKDDSVAAEEKEPVVEASDEDPPPPTTVAVLEGGEEKVDNVPAAVAATAGSEREDDDDDDVGGEFKVSKRESQKLSRMSLNTAVAIALHNFPEGLATFVAALDDPAVGAVLAIAIAIHNIPEGLCVAMPVYYATGNRWRAFLWALLSGVSEPIAAFFGWLVLANSFSDTLYAVLFGMVAGMMVIISVRELLPTAHRYDPDDSVVTYSFIVGMGIMAVSLVLFIL